MDCSAPHAWPRHAASAARRAAAAAAAAAVTDWCSTAHAWLRRAPSAYHRNATVTAAVAAVKRQLLLQYLLIHHHVCLINLHVTAISLL
jgi:hypothetical protein